jgi:hypothetical protein
MMVGSEAAGKSKGPGIVDPEEDVGADDDVAGLHATTTNINEIINLVIFSIKSPYILFILSR